MFSLIHKILRAARSFDATSDRIQKIEARLANIDKILERFEILADENESLWQFLDEQKEMNGVFMGSAEEFEKEISDIMLKNMKTRGDA
jgi:3-methyladenine DNA glycosylase Tag